MDPHTPNEPLVSVVTLTFNRPAALVRCLESLAAQTLPRDRFELVVVDVSDKPVTAALARCRDRLDILHVHGDNLGVAGNRNRGARHARGEWLAFIDDDCVAEPGWLEQLMEVARVYPERLLSGGVRNMHPGNAVSCAGQVITEAVDACFNPAAGEPTFAPGLNFAVRRDAYLSLGGNDESFGRLAAEDRDFVDRWRHAGRRVMKAEGAVVVHEHRCDFRGFVRQYFNYGRGAWRYHSLAWSRESGSLGVAMRLHRHMWQYAGKPLRRLPVAMRVRVVPLLLVWELANASGFAWQAGRELFDRRFAGNRS